MGLPAMGKAIGMEIPAELLRRRPDIKRQQMQATYLLEALETSEKSTELSMLQYQEGLADYQRVLDATRSLTQKQDQYAQTQGKIATSFVALYKAFGGGWQIPAQRGKLSEEVLGEISSRTDWGNQLPITQTRVE
jgi:outer membrane protein TolC